MADTHPKPVYALVALSYEGKPQPVGTRLDEILPAEVLAACVKRGEAGPRKPR